MNNRTNYPKGNNERYNKKNINPKQSYFQNSTSGQYNIFPNCLDQVNIHSGICLQLNPPKKAFSNQNIPRNPSTMFVNNNFSFPDNYSNSMNMYPQNIQYDYNSSKTINKLVLDNKPRYQEFNMNSLSSNYKLHSMFDNMYLDGKNKKETNEMSIMQNSQDLIRVLKTQKGSRMMQKYVNKRSPEEIFAILKKILNYIKELMCDSYANYFIQRLFQCCTCNQRLEILKRVKYFKTGRR
jgi:hypothetical protein